MFQTGYFIVSVCVRLCSQYILIVAFSFGSRYTFWSLVESHLSGCFCLFASNILDGDIGLQMIKLLVGDHSLSSLYTDMWRGGGHSNINCYNQIYLNFLHSETVDISLKFSIFSIYRKCKTI